MLRARDQLPPPDERGNYWLSNGKGRIFGPAIFPSKLPRSKGKFFAISFRGELVISVGGGIRYFASALEAFQFI